MTSSDRTGTPRPRADVGLRMRMRSEERRITSQHEKLDDLCREVYTRIDKDGAAKATSDFQLFATALDAHMTVEEDIYFPALHGLRPDAGEALARLVAEHDQLRRRVDEVKRALERGERDDAKRSLDDLAREVTAHEAQEEDLIVQINEGPVLDDGRHSI